MPAHSAAKLFSPPLLSIELLGAEFNTSVDMLNRMEMRIFVAKKVCVHGALMCKRRKL